MTGRELVNRFRREQDGWGCTLTLVTCESDNPKVLNVNCRFATSNDVEVIGNTADETEHETGDRPEIDLTQWSWLRIYDSDILVRVHWFITAEEGITNEQVETAIYQAQSAFEKKGARFVAGHLFEFDDLEATNG